VLSDVAIRTAKPRDKPYKLSDGGGLYVTVQAGGGKLWRLKYRFCGKEKLLSFGPYPTIPLARAREKREEVKKLLIAGTDPATQKKLDKLAAERAAANTFGAVAAEHLDNLEASGTAEATMVKNRWMLQTLAAPLAKRPIGEILPIEVLDVLKRIEKSGRRETARKLRGAIGAVFRYAIVTVRATNDPTVSLRGALLRPKVEHRAAITDEHEFGILMHTVDEYDGWPTIRAALQLLALTMTRPGDVRGMRRSEINFEMAVWRIPAERMKMRRPHDVPLSRQALEIIRDIWPLSDDGELVLPSVRSNKKPLSENALNCALRRMGYEKHQMTSHGFRATASTILAEPSRGLNPDVIEAALGHQDKNAIRRAYNRATYWPELVKLMQTWADILDGIKKSTVTNRRAA
jgi:integrase